MTMVDGIEISTTAITALLGGGGLGALIQWSVGRRKCDKCDAHPALATNVQKTREDIAAIKADIKNICRSVDELRDDFRALGAARGD
jgi:hypothetical protein